MDKLRILILEDSPADAEIAIRALQREGMSFEWKCVETQDAYREALESFGPGLIISDYSLPGFDGMKAIALAREVRPDTPIIMYTGSVNEETAVACLMAGAQDYVLKTHLARLAPACRSALAAAREREERRFAEKALQESEMRFRTLVEAANDAIVLVSGGEIVFWNSSAGEMFGYTQKEVRGMLLSRLIPEPLREHHQKWLGTGSNQDKPQDNTQESVGIRRDGTEFPVEISLSAWEDGEETTFNVIIRDLSDREESQGALERLSRKHEAFLESAGEGILGIDARGLVSFANPAALTLLDYEVEEILGEPAHAQFHGGGDTNLCTEEECTILSSIREKSSWHGETRFFRRDGSFIHVSGWCMPQEGVGEEGALMMFEDITDRKENEEALRKSEEQYRSLVENAIYGIYKSTPDGRFLSVNPALAEMLGYGSVEELMTMNIVKDLYGAPEDRRQLMKKMEKKDRMDGLDVDWRRKDGTIARLRLSGRPYFATDGAPEFFEVFAEDLSARKILEDQLRQAQKMEAVGQLTGGIAHDFNNVLAVILLNSEIIAGALQKGTSVDPADVIAIRDAAKRAAGITRKLLSFSRQAELKTVPTDLGRVLGNMGTMLRTAVPESVELRIRTETEIPTVMVDETAIEQSLLNLVTNARDAMPKGGVLSVTLKEVLLDEEYCAQRAEAQPGLHVCLEVSDTGMGMDAETQRRVFEPFFTTKDPGTGTGLGLAMVYGLTKQQGGHVGLYSEKGEGTTFRLYFPAYLDGAEQTGVTASPENLPGGTETLLVVEDQVDLRSTAKRALERQGYTVLTASNGREALEVLEESAEPVALVFSDLVMPVMGGVELIQALGDHGYAGKLLLASGYISSEIRGEALTDIPFIQKPWLLSDLLRAVRDSLDEDTEKESTHG